MLFTKQIVIHRYKLYNYGQHIVPYSRRVWQGKRLANEEPKTIAELMLTYVVLVSILKNCRI